MLQTKLALLFWIEAGLAAISSLLFFTTILWHNWIELLFKFDPDAGSGGAEWLTVLGTGATAAIFITATAGTWRRLKTTERNARFEITAN